MPTKTVSTKTMPTKTARAKTMPTKAVSSDTPPSEISPADPVAFDNKLEALGAELDDLRRRTIADLGDRDRDYLDNMVGTQRRLELAGRALLFAGFLPPAWLAGTVALSLSKILDNMEIGHNVMHGQYDFLDDPDFAGNTFDWDNACAGEQWRQTHNYEHHTFTNIRGKDHDIGYRILRVVPEQKWNPLNLGNPAYAVGLATLFQYGVMFHGVSKPSEFVTAGRKFSRQTLKDYVLFPLLTGPSAPLTFAANATANLARNLWSFTIIFCGHFPEGVATFSEEETADESRGAWYRRQMLGSANIEGSPLFDILSGNLSYQIEHHLFPDIPAHRYKEMSVEVREICERYELPYNSGSLGEQFGSVVSKIVKLAVPWGLRGR